VNRNDLSRAVYEAHGGLSFAEAQKVVDVILETVKSRLARGERVLISGFGCFRVVERKEKKGADPQTGAPILIRGRKAVSFKPSRFLKSL
jgi:DNA-binding protein HU-beta